MSEAESVLITDKRGTAFRAWLKPPENGSDDKQVTLQLMDGTQFLVPRDVLISAGEGRFELNMNLRDYARGTGTEETEDTVIPLVEETLKVGKRIVERGRVQLHKYVTERTETVEVPLAQERLEVERVEVGRTVDEAASVRHEGDTMIIPLYEEVLVVTKQLMLVEEVRITTRRSERQEPQQVTLRREEASVERLDGDERKEDEGL